MSRMKIVVKKKHIKNGVCSDPTECPIALAMTDAGARNTSVSSSRVSFISFNGKAVNTEFTQKIKKFISLFDRNQTVKPDTFTLTY